MTITGSCLCGAIRHEMNEGFHDAGNCDCSMCRKAHDAAFASYASIEPAEFRWVTGEALVTAYESSPAARRLFCTVCGSALGATIGGRMELVAPGTVDCDAGIRPRSHIFDASKAFWHEISDQLPHLAEMPPGEGWA